METLQMEERIDRFVNNEMSPDERSEFCRKMENDSELREQVVLRTLLVEAELTAAEKEVRLVLEPAMSSFGHKKRYRYIAAACVVILIIGGGLIGNSQQYTSSEIYETHYSIPAIERARGEGGLTEELAIFNREVTALYEQKNYAGVVKLYSEDQQEKKVSSLPISTLLYISVALLEQNEAPEAVLLLGPLVNSVYQEEAEWLLLCSYLQISEREKAVKLAEKIRTGKGIYSEKADQIEHALKQKRWF